MTSKRRFALPLVALLLSAVTLVPMAQGATVSLYLKWVPQYQFAGYMVAKALGYYSAAGLAVRIIAGGPDINTVQEVADGAAQFGIQTPEPIFYARSKGLRLTMLMADFQRPYEEFMVRKTSAIRTIRDFRGKAIGINIGGLSQLLLPYVLKKSGLRPNDVRVMRKTLSLAPFLSGRIPIWNGYVGNEPYQALDAGVPVREFRLSQYVPHWYGDVLFAKTSYVKSHPKIVKAFVLASQRGWEYALHHKRQTVAILLKDNPQKTRLELLQEAQAAMPLMTSPHAHGCFGRIQTRRVADMEKTMNEFGSWHMNPPPPAVSFVDDRFLSCPAA